tara:strand:+ start:170 stop:445 length:276 start_codon:yes stop_codon:yes gene_type:complete
MAKIKIGDKIRSLDFPDIYRDTTGKDACFVEGIVLKENVDPFYKTGPYFLVKVTKRVWGGEESDFSEDPIKYCPMPHAVGMRGKLNSTTKI